MRRSLLPLMLRTLNNFTVEADEVLGRRCDCLDDRDEKKEGRSPVKQVDLVVVGRRRKVGEEEEVAPQADKTDRLITREVAIVNSVSGDKAAAAAQEREKTKDVDSARDRPIVS
jgi:hypothetical protein